MGFKETFGDVEFKDVYYTVKTRTKLFQTDETTILHGVSGSFRSGQLSAIMGPSGAGKSSLLNAISGLKTSDVDGYIKTDHKLSCYITQEDNHITLFTVNELMHFSYNLKVKDKQNMETDISDILKNLSLLPQRHTLVERLSGGEKKRLSIALELVSHPTIFFLDEPTTGLDEVTALQCISLLHKLAKQGLAIICTIHQPSPTIFDYFDRVFVMARGQCVYQGHPNGMLSFLRNVGIECPKHYSPSDYIMEVCDSNNGALIPNLRNFIDNGKFLYLPQDNCESVDGICSELCSSIIATVPEDKSKTKIVKTNSNRQPKVPGIYQFYILLQMMLTKLLRSRIVLSIMTLHHVFCGLTYGLIFLNTGNHGERVYDHVKICFSLVCTLVFTQSMIPALNYPVEVKMMKKHVFNRWYSVTPYFSAVTLSRIPTQFIWNMILFTLTYWMAGMPAQWWRFCLFVLVGQLTSLIAEGLGLFVGSIFSVTNGNVVNALFTSWLLSAAFYGIDFGQQVSSTMKAMMDLSFMRIGMHALTISMFGFNRDPMDCNEVYCHYKHPHVFLRYLDLQNRSMVNLLIMLVGFIIFFRVLLFLSLRRRCKT